MTAFFFGRIARVGHARSRGEVNATDVQARFAEVNRANGCHRCCATAKAMEYVRHQWVVAGIDKGE